MTGYKIQTNEVIVDNWDKKYVLRVRDLADDDKPREKLIECGPESLSSPELLAIILNTGTKKEEVMNMASRILKEYGEKTLATQTNPKILEKEFGVPLVKACQIVACFELGRRFCKQNMGRVVYLRSAKQVFEYLKDMRTYPKEQFRAVYLNSRYHVVHDEVISVGSLTANVVHPREVFKPAIDHSAVAVIVAHNHPSGSSKPTEADIELTRQLVDAGKIIGIDVLDHLIITKNNFSSINFD